MKRILRLTSCLMLGRLTGKPEVGFPEASNPSLSCRKHVFTLQLYEEFLRALAPTTWQLALDDRALIR